MALTDSIVAYYKCDTNGSLNDSVASYNLTIDGATYTASGKINGAYYFDGINDRAYYAGNLGYTGTADWSVSIWIKFGSYTQGVLYFQLTNSTTSNNFNMYYYDKKVYFGKVRRAVTDAPSFTAPSTGTWVHLIATYVNSTGICNVYKDGNTTPIATGNLSGNGSGETYDVFNLCAGAPNILNGDATIDEVGIWSRGLSTDEVTELYNSGSGLQYPFSSGSAIKTLGGLAKSSVKTVGGLAIASVKSIGGLE